MDPIPKLMPALDFPPGSSGDAVREILACANDAMAPWAGPAATEAAAALRALDNAAWRAHYPAHAVRHHELLASSPAACLAGARAGLAATYSTFQLGGEVLRQALARPAAGLPLNTGVVRGVGAATEWSTAALALDPAPSPAPSAGVRPPHNGDVFLPMGGGVTLEGDRCMGQLEAWAREGVIEPDVVDAMRGVRQRGDARPGTGLAGSRSSCGPGGVGDGGNAGGGSYGGGSADWAFVVLGAGAAMGPLETLLALGATVVAVDIPSAAVWRRLAALARASPGTLLFPVRGPGGEYGGCGLGGSSCDEGLLARAGVDLVANPAGARDWVAAQCPGARLCVGSYAYLDAALFVKVSLAMDVVAHGALELRAAAAAAAGAAATAGAAAAAATPARSPAAQEGEVVGALAYLCSPTDVFAVPAACRAASAAAFARGSGSWASPEGFAKAALRGLGPVAGVGRGAFATNVGESSSPRLSRLPLVDR